MAGEVGGGDPLSKLRCVLDAATVHAADDQAAQVGEVPAGAGNGLDDEMLALPVLYVADDSRNGSVEWDAELAADRLTAARPELLAIDAVVDGEQPARLQVPGAAVVGDLLRHADASVDPARRKAFPGTD